jgi:hypothetical protein
VREVWGVGRKLEEKLVGQGVRTVADLRALDPAIARRQHSVVLERTVRELQGVACLDLEEVAPNKQQIIASRSFGEPVYDVGELAESVRAYMTRAAEKLRRQNGVAGAVGVWIETNRFRAQDRQYCPSLTLNLPEATDDTLRLVGFATAILRRIHRVGFRYVKAGVMLLDLRDRAVQQGSLFDATPAFDEKRARLMSVLDRATQKWGRGTIAPGSAGLAEERRWAMTRGSMTRPLSKSPAVAVASRPALETAAEDDWERGRKLVAFRPIDDLRIRIPHCRVYFIGVGRLTGFIPAIQEYRIVPAVAGSHHVRRRSGKVPVVPNIALPIAEITHCPTLRIVIVTRVVGQRVVLR